MTSASARDRLRRTFAAAHFAKSLTWSAVDLLQAYFLHIVLGMSAAETARILLTLMLCGAVGNVMVGAAMDRLRPKPRSILAFHIGAAILTAIGLLMQFEPGRQRGAVIVFGLLFRLAYVAYDVPQTAMTSLFPADEADAQRYVALRTALSALARLAVAGANLALLQLPAALFRGGLSVLMAGFATSLVLTAGALFRAGRGAPYVVQTVRKITWQALPPRSIRLLVCFALSTALLPILSRLLIFSNAPSTGLSSGGMLLFAYTLANVIGPFVVARLEARWGWRRLWWSVIGLGIISGDLLAFALTRPSWLGIGLTFIYGLALGCVGTLEWELASRLVRRHAQATGQRTDGLMFGMVIFTIQLSVAAGTWLLGFFLDLMTRNATYGAALETLAMTFSGMLVGLGLADGL